MSVFNFIRIFLFSSINLLRFCDVIMYVWCHEVTPCNNITMIIYSELKNINNDNIDLSVKRYNIK